MKKELIKIKNKTFLNLSSEEIQGKHTKIRGNTSNIRGDVTNIKGNIDECGITDEERKNGINIIDLVKE